jgi:hypothetical protein
MGLDLAQAFLGVSTGQVHSVDEAEGEWSVAVLPEPVGPTTRVDLHRARNKMNSL